jgi:hypothetical protein
MKPKYQFFNVSEYSYLDLKLSIPRIFLPFSTDKIIPKVPSPLWLWDTRQTNIGLDKENFTGGISYIGLKRYNSARLTYLMFNLF